MLRVSKCLPLRLPARTLPCLVCCEQDLEDGTTAAAVVRVMYSLGLLLTSPLQLFPAVKVKLQTIPPHV